MMEIIKIAREKIGDIPVIGGGQKETSV